MAIWLYYTKKGNLAKIQHGEVLRQGSSFKIIYAFEDKDIILNKSLSVAFKKPGEETGLFMPVGKFTEQDLLSSTSRVKFSKIKSTEMTYGLQDGKEYYCLTGHYDPGVTEKYGTLTVVTKISTQVGELDRVDADRDGQLDNTENNDIVYFNGSVQLYIEPTYGKQQDTSNISLDQYNSLVEQINEISSKKVNVDDGLARNLTLEGKTNATGVELDDELPSGIYANEPIHDKQVTNKEYVDKISEKLEDKVDKLDGEATNLKLKGTTYANFENSKILVNTPDDNSDSQQVVNREYADTKVKADGGTASNLTLTGKVKAKSDGTYLEINNPIEDYHPVTKQHFDVKIGDLTKLESFSDLEKVDIVSAINNATTKKEVAELLIKYVIADDVDEDFAPIEEVNLTYVYQAERAICDSKGENIADNIAMLKETSTSATNVANLISSHNDSANAHSDLINALNTKIDTNVSTINQKIATDIKSAIDGLIDGADGAYNTLKEIEKELKANDTDISNILTTLNGKASTSRVNEVEAKIPTGASGKSIVDSITGSKNIPTDEAVKKFVENKNYLTGITKTQVENALGFTPYNSTNPNKYITANDNINGTAANADKFNNQSADFYATKDDIKNFVAIEVVDNVIIIG